MCIRDSPGTERRQSTTHELPAQTLEASVLRSAGEQPEHAGNHARYPLLQVIGERDAHAAALG